MHQSNPIPVVDLFAGPGGLGEGFSSFGDGKAFKILVSAEMDSSAHQTLRLRSFFRILKQKGGNALASYYRYCNGESATPWDQTNAKDWEEAGNEARQITLGTPSGNRELFAILDNAGLNQTRPWVLIGGPPCQAYSLVGRARNRGKADYKAEDDHRHFLYREYLKIIQKYRPAIFVMENVKGILSSKVHDQQIFHTILRDLSDPGLAITKRHGQGYRIHSLVVPTVFEQGMNPNQIDVHDFIIRAENHGIPQARHRVILLGVREDIETRPSLLQVVDQVTFKDAVAGLPALRSRLSKEVDSPDKWHEVVSTHLQELLEESMQRSDLTEIAENLREIKSNLKSDLRYGAVRERIIGHIPSPVPELERWYHDSNLKVLLNHEARGHMSPDLRRYLYAAAYASAYKRSPKGHEAFDLAGLRPEHKNWESGKFADRFRVQLYERPATTVTSHISKDGHYFIHPDPVQCRSLTVREAARLQTFPDNYFFQGNRTQQFHQVGNAVPPLLAYKIAGKVSEILK
jgi:DNA (cytosine-5)-methyltransferase 1